MRGTLSVGRRLWWGIPLLIVVLWVLGALLPSFVDGLPEAPWVTWVTLPITRYARDVAAAVTVGCVAVGALLTPGRSHRVLRWASGWAVVWLAVLVVQFILTVSDVLAIGVGDALDPTTLWSVLTQVPIGQVALAQAVGVAFVAAFSWAVLGRFTAWLVMLVALAACAAPALLGHAELAGGHTAAQVSLALHIGAVSLWVGGLVATVALLLVEPARARALLPRFSVMALICVLVIAETGLLNATQHATSAAAFLRSDYGSLVIAKAVLLGWLVLLGWRQRSRVIPLLDDSESVTVGALARLASWEFLAMGAAIAISVTMSRVGPVGEPTARSYVSPVTMTLLALALPLLIGRVFRPSPEQGWVRFAQSYPELAAVVMAIVVVEVAGTGLFTNWFGADAGAVVGALALVAAGIPFAVSIQGDRARSGVIAAMVAWAIIIPVTVRLSARQFTASPDARVVVAALVLAEALLAVTLFAAERRSTHSESPSSLVEA